jgi:hypothetical protein
MVQESEWVAEKLARVDSLVYESEASNSRQEAR